MTNIQEKPNPTPGPWRFTRVDINVNRIGHYVENVAGRMDALWSDTTSHAVAVPAHPAQHGFGSFGFTDADAEFVLYAVNACHAINPSNPLAAAKALPVLIKALEEIAVGEGLYGLQAGEYKKIARDALASIRDEGNEL